MPFPSKFVRVTPWARRRDRDTFVVPTAYGDELTDKAAFRLHALRAEAACSKELKVALGLMSDEAELLSRSRHGTQMKTARVEHFPCRNMSRRNSSPAVLQTMQASTTNRAAKVVAQTRQPSMRGQVSFQAGSPPDVFAHMAGVASFTSSKPTKSRGAIGQRALGRSLHHLAVHVRPHF